MFFLKIEVSIVAIENGDGGRGRIGIRIEELHRSTRP